MPDTELVLDVLAQDYNVEIFPVSVIGSTDSQKLLSPLLCLSAEERPAHWKSLFAADAGMAPGNNDVPDAECKDGLHALNIRLAFDHYQLPGTPQLLADDGREIPLSVLTSDIRLVFSAGENGLTFDLDRWTNSGYSTLSNPPG
ncbi:hypothetical protein ACLBOM_36525 [Escherichia coli]